MPRQKYYTLNDRLDAYCLQTGTKVKPYSEHLRAMSNAIINAVNDAGMGELIRKKDIKVPMNVNSYPEKAATIIDGIIAEYFTSKKSFAAKYKMKIAAVTYFNYDLEEYKIQAFEKALQGVGIPVVQNFNQNGRAQYKIPLADPVRLIKLGKHFKWHQLQEKQERRYNNFRKQNKEIQTT